MSETKRVPTWGEVHEVEAAIIRGVVPGHGGDLYYVQHEAHDLHCAVYCFTEFEVES
jgi:hypothetical protein